MEEHKKKLDAAENTEQFKDTEDFSTNKNKKPIAICNKMKGKVGVEKIKKHQSDFQRCELSSLELRRSICAGNAFCSQFNGARKIDNFTCTGFIALDFDEGKSLEQVLEDEYIKQYASFIYTTPSHRVQGSGDRFRVVFELGSAIRDVTVVTKLLKSLMVKFPKADQSCKDPCRIFFGSPGCDIYVIDKRLTEEEVERLIVLDKSKRKESNYNILSAINADDIREMLKFMNPMPGHSVWRDIIWSIKSWCVQNSLPDELGKELIEEWSPDYKTGGFEIDKLFREYRHGIISIGTLIFFAKNNGYDAPKKFVKPRMPGQVIVEDLFYERGSYATINGDLCQYKQGCYEPLSDSLLEQRIGAYFDHYITDFKTGKTGYATKASIQDALRFAKTTFYVNPELVNPPGLNLQNGYLKLAYDKEGTPNWKLEPHSQKSIFTYKADFQYDPKCNSEIYQGAIDNILIEQEQTILFRSLAASFDLNEVRKRQGRSVRILLLYGDGSNGKDTIREWLYALYGQKGISSIPLQAFRSADSRRTFSIYDVSSSKVNWSSENAAVSIDNCQTLKNCVTGDPIFVEKKQQQGHSVRARSIFLFNINQLPKLEAKQEAISSRYGILYFRNTFKSFPDPSDPFQRLADPRLKDDREYIFKNIMPALLNQLIKSYGELLEHGIDYSFCKGLLQEIRERNDHFAEFLSIDPMIECDIGEGVGARFIFDRYKRWCIDTGLVEEEGARTIYHDPSKCDRIIRDERQITRKLEEYFPRMERKRSNNKRILGLKFLDCEE